MTHRTILITGASDGIGKAAALQLAKLGAHIILLCRNPAKGEAAMREIEAATASPNLELLLCDLGSQKSIRAAAEIFKKKHERLHVLINNAGVWERKRRTTSDGFEAAFGVNHLGHFLLTNLLLDALKAGAPSRIINVSSGLHHSGRMAWEDLQYEKRTYDGQEAYAQSKLANVLFTRELARRLAGSGVTVNAVHPGVISTNLLHSLAAPIRLVAGVAFASPETGAKPLVRLASAAELEGLSGRYFDKLKESDPSPSAKDDEAARRLWDLSEKLTA